MLAGRLLFLFVACMATGMVQGQAIARKNLITSLGGGTGLLTISRAADSVSASAVLSGAITFRVQYAFTKRFSLGIQYDRIGSDRIGKAVDHVRFSTLFISGSYRPWIGERAFVEAHAAIGTAALSLDLFALSLPVVGRSGSSSIGARYVHRLSGTLCAFAGVEATGGSRIYLQRFDGKPFADADGQPGALDWSSQRVLVGMAVRF
ncbi:MAG TPA: hypothetical protein PKY96_11270 [Flavobacteriales bacterium]|nr:hypothetical protein [Flavobacteriales bacterium]